MNEDLPSGPSEDSDLNKGIVTRRRALMMGAVTASAVVSIKPALAQTAGSVLNCEIPVPGNHASGGYIAADGAVVTSDTPGAYPPAGRNFTGEEVRRAVWHDLDSMTLLYHRPSGITHLLADPAPAIIEVMGKAEVTAAEIAFRLTALFDVDTGVDAEDIVIARLEELSALGLVSRVSG